MDSGTNVHLKDTQGNSALTVAIGGKQTSIRNLLYEAGAMVMLGEDCVSLELLSALSHFQSMGYVNRFMCTHSYYLHPLYALYTPLLPYMHLCTPVIHVFTPHIHPTHL